MKIFIHTSSIAIKKEIIFTISVNYMSVSGIKYLLLSSFVLWGLVAITSLSLDKDPQRIVGEATVEEISPQDFHGSNDLWRMESGNFLSAFTPTHQPFSKHLFDSPHFVLASESACIFALYGRKNRNGAPSGEIYLLHRNLRL